MFTMPGYLRQSVIVLAGMLLFAMAQAQQPAGICSRTEQVRTAILSAVSAVSECALVTSTHLASIQSLTLSNRSITSLAAGDFAGLTGLTTLSLYGNRLSTLPAGLFSDLTSLTTLSLHRNRLTALPAAIFTPLTSLTKLHLSQNHLSSPDANLFSGLSSLTTLTLNSNALAGLPASLFSGLSALQTLQLHANRLTSLQATQFQGLAALELLTLYDNALTTLPTSVFANLSALEHLALGRNQLASLPASAFSGLSSLQILALNHNELTGLPTGLFTGLSALEHLDLSGNAVITNNGLAQSRLALTGTPFAGLSSLKRLLLRHNALNDLPADLFKDLTSLQILDLSGNSLADLPTSPFASLTRLQRLLLNHNRLGTLDHGIFTGLTSLNLLDLRCNDRTSSACPADASFALPLQIRSLGGDRFEIGVPHGAPYAIAVRIVATNRFGTLNSFTTTTIPAGATASAAFSIAGLSGIVRLNAGITNTASVISFRGISIAGSILDLEFNNRLNFTNSVDDLALTTDTEVDLSLPAAIGSSGSITYSLTATTADGTLVDKLPAGLSFDASTRILSGTPTAPGTYSLTYTATASNGKISLTFSSEVSDPPPVLASRALDSISVFTLTNTAITPLPLPAVKPGTGSGNISYTLYTVTTFGIRTQLTSGIPGLSILPAGLSFDANTRTLSGTPTAPGIYQMRYGAIDSNSIFASYDFFVVVSDALAFSSTQPDKSYGINRTIAPLILPQATGGPAADTVSPLTYSLVATTTTGTLTNNLPAGLRFDANTRILSGTPTAVGTYRMAYTVTDNNRNLVQSFDIVVPEALNFSSTQADQTYSINRIIMPLVLPETTGGGANRTYSLAGTTSDGTLVNDLPAGLMFDANTHTLSGTPTAAGTYRMTYTGTDQNAVATQDFDIVVTEALAFAKAQADQTYSINRTITPLILPQADGGLANRTYSLEGTTSDGTLVNDLPAGLIFVANTRTLSGTPTAPGTYRMTHTVTDKDKVAVTQNFDIVVTQALAFNRNQADQTGIESRAIAPLMLPQADGGIPTLTYSLAATTSDGTLTGDDLPAGLSFTPATRTLSGTPTAAGTYRMTHTVTDKDKVVVTQGFDFTVGEALAFATPQASRAYITNQAIKSLELPQADGGIPTLTYSLAGTTSDGDLDWRWSARRSGVRRQHPHPVRHTD